MDQVVLTLLFFIIAMLYAAAGFGGGSSYLALLAWWGVAMPVMRPIALLCNLIVVSGNLLVYRKEGYLELKKMLPLALLSVPLAFLGGYFPLREKTFFLLLGGSLVLAGILLLLQSQFTTRNNATVRPQKPWLSAGIGGGIGFLSGMVGIGGGIFLSPVLHFLRWDNSKVIAASASMFIFVNSLAGLAGQWARNFSFDLAMAAPLLLAVLLGGQLGSRLSIRYLTFDRVRIVTALLIIYAGGNIVYQHI